ncbi:MAG: DUF2062 domain-containing protein [Pseudomonadota bacterium]
MLFGRREPLTFFERVRIAVWPRESWSRSMAYAVMRLRRLGGSPHKVALGAAIGAFMACSPYLGVQMVLAGLLAFMMRASLSAAMIGTLVANPLTIPILSFASFYLGSGLLGVGGEVPVAHLQAGLEEVWNAILAMSPAVWDTLGRVLWPVLVPMSIGFLPVGLIVALATYVVAKRAVEAYRSRRASDIAARLSVDLGIGDFSKASESHDLEQRELIGSHGAVR